MNKLTFKRMWSSNWGDDAATGRTASKNARRGLRRGSRGIFSLSFGENVMPLIDEYCCARGAATRQKLANILFWFCFVTPNLRCENLLWQPITRTRVLRADRYGHPLRFIRSEVISCLSPWKRANLPAANMRAPSDDGDPLRIRRDSCRNADKYLPSLFLTGNKRVCVQDVSGFCHPYCYLVFGILVNIDNI